jgi:CRISPR-associated RAMP protein (TIGR02581 family)
MNHKMYHNKVKISGTLHFETAFHIGSGKEGDLATDMGVMKDEQGWPVLPGSTLKGCFRATAEKLANYLALKACMLDSSLSEIDCVGDQAYFRQVNDAFQKIKKEKDKLTWLQDHTCHVCRFFGSPMQSARIFFSDGRLIRWAGGYQVRDGVVIDRDAGTARDGFKYDFEVTPKDTAFGLTIDLENPEPSELGLVSAVLAEWQNGFRLGGFTSRGLGRVFLTQMKTEALNYKDPDQLKAYLLNRVMQSADHLFSDALQTMLAQKEDSHA